jgi:hypothetical protein
LKCDEKILEVVMQRPKQLGWRARIMFFSRILFPSTVHNNNICSFQKYFILFSNELKFFVCPAPFGSSFEHMKKNAHQFDGVALLVKLRWVARMNEVMFQFGRFWRAWRRATCDNKVDGIREASIREPKWNTGVFHMTLPLSNPHGEFYLVQYISENTKPANQSTINTSAWVGKLSVSRFKVKFNHVHYNCVHRNSSK